MSLCRFAWVSVVVVSWLAFTGVARAVTDDELRRQAEVAVQGGNHSRAVVLYRALIDRDPKPDYLLELARCYRKLNDKPNAVVHYEKYARIVNSGPGYAEAQTYLAMNGTAQPTSRSAPPLVAPQADDTEGPRGARAPEAPPPTSNAFVLVPWSVQEKVRKQHVNICGDDDGRWKFCEVGGRNRSENDFIHRYQRFTGSTELDRYITPNNPIGLSVVGGISAVSTILLGVGLGYVVKGEDLPSSDPNHSSYRRVGYPLAATGAAFLCAATLFGWPFAVFQPRTQHKIPRDQAQRYVNEYNRGLERTFGLSPQ